MRKFVNYIKRKWVAYLMVLPLAVGMAVFSIYPPIRGLVISFFDVYKVTDGLNNFVGFDNFKNLFGDTIFLNSAKTLLTLQLPRLIVNCSVPFIYAELLFAVSNKKAQGAYRIIMLLPMVCPSIVNTLIWQYYYAYDGGLFNEALMGLGIITENIDFLGVDHVIKSLIFMGFPWLPGISALIVFSGLINIPSEVIEASQLDGCGPFKRIFVLHLPYLIGQIKYVVVFGIINIFQDYSNQLLFADKVGAVIYVPAYYMYRLVNTNQDIGKAAAIGVVLFVIIMLITAATYKLLNAKDEENV